MKRENHRVALRLAVVPSVDPRHAALSAGQFDALRALLDPERKGGGS